MPAYLEPESARFRTEDTPDGLKLVIPARRHGFVLLFLLAWFGGWTMGELTVGRQVLFGVPHPATAFMLFWLIAWTLGGFAVLTSILWLLAGREVITVSAATLSYRAEALGIGRSRLYRAGEVRNLRVSALPQGFANQRSLLSPLIAPNHGAVAFDYGARTVRLAPSLDEAEAQMLVRDIAARLPRH